ARREQRVLGEAGRWMLVEDATGPRERAHHGRAVALHEHRGRAPGRVVARLRFAFEHDDAAPPGEPVPERGAGDAGAHDGHVKFSHTRILSCENHAMASGKTTMK